MRRNGFVSMSLIYAFFIVFIAIMLALLGTYANNRILAGRVNQDIMKNIDTLNASLCSYDPGDEVLNRTASATGLIINNSETFDGGQLNGRIKLTCSGYYRVELTGTKGKDNEDYLGGKGILANAVLRLTATTVVHYSVGNQDTITTGNQASIRLYYNYNYATPMSVVNGKNATSTGDGNDGTANISTDNYVFEQYTKAVNDTIGRIKITYIGANLS